VTADGATARGRLPLDGLRVAVGQVGASVGDASANVAVARTLLRRAAARGADLLVLPECFSHGYSLNPRVLRLAQPTDGPIATGLRSIAAAAGVALVAGFVERNPADAARPFNSALVIDRAGRLVGVYRKTHLFGSEPEGFTPGDSYPVFELRIRPGRPALPVGVAICADLEYPEVARLLALEGARLLCVPSADMEPYRAQQAANLMSRAIENNVHVALANTVDRRERVDFFGGSGIARPDGTLVSAGYGRPRLVVAELSDAAVAASGGEGAYLRHRRPATYGGLVDR
jgi:predicted amidohydrolase